MGEVIRLLPRGRVVVVEVEPGVWLAMHEWQDERESLFPFSFDNAAKAAQVGRHFAKDVGYEFDEAGGDISLLEWRNGTWAVDHMTRSGSSAGIVASNLPTKWDAVQVARRIAKAYRAFFPEPYAEPPHPIEPGGHAA